VAESRVLDYKERLPGDSDADKREMLADVTAFANSAGGDLIYGVKERRKCGATGEPEAVVGLPDIGYQGPMASDLIPHGSDSGGDHRHPRTGGT
jgi:predicted HTH transcriptional regulator